MNPTIDDGLTIPLTPEQKRKLAIMRAAALNLECSDKAAESGRVFLAARHRREAARLMQAVEVPQ